MKTFKVYLAGPIAGLTYESAVDWRSVVPNMMPASIHCYCPLRGKAFLSEAGILSSSGYEQNPVSSSHGIMGRDHNDVKTSDCVLMNLLGAKKVSIGSVMEAAWCFAYRIPLVLVIEDRNNIHEHTMLNEVPVYRVSALDRGCQLVQQLLLP